MREADVAEHVVTKWASLVVFLSKKNGKLRFCVDYRCLNAVAEKDSYLIPRRDECIDLLGKAKMFPTLDASSSSWIIEKDNKDVNKTAFVTHHGPFKYTRMPFGLKNAPASFHRAIDVILTSVK